MDITSMDINYILIIFLMSGGIFFIYIGLGGPLLGGGKIETQKFGILAVVIGVVFSILGIFLSLGITGITEKNRLAEVEKVHVKAEEGAKPEKQLTEAEQARLQTEKKLAEAEQARLQTEKKLAEADRARFKAEAEAERTRLKAETQAQLAQLKEEIEGERNRRLKMEKEIHKTEPKVIVTQHEKLRSSFDCNQASTTAEELICSDEQLSDADGRLGKLYAQVEQSLEDSEHLKEEQKKWLIYRDQQLARCNKDIHCAIQVYEDRIAQLASQVHSPISAKQWWGVVTTQKNDPLNIRSEMNMRAQVIDTIAHGEKILVLADYGKWYQVQSSDNTIGFAVSQLISRSETPLQWGVVMTEQSDLNVRAEMKANAPIIGKVKKHAKVLILEKHGDWYHIQLEPGITGYVIRQLITLEE